MNSKIVTGKVFLVSMYYFGMFMLIWLAVGFILGLKEIYVDEMFTEEAIEELKEMAPLNAQDLIDLIYKNKRTFLAFYALLGFMPLFVIIQSRLNGE